MVRGSVQGCPTRGYILSKKQTLGLCPSAVAIKERVPQSSVLRAKPCPLIFDTFSLIIQLPTAGWQVKGFQPRSSNLMF